MPDAEYTRIELDPKTITNLKALSKILGSKRAASQLERVVKVTNKLAKMALDSYKSKVPVDTQELRDQHIKILKQARQSSPYAIVGVKDGTHIGRNKRPKSAVELAQVLQRGEDFGHTLKRTRTSLAVEGYSAIAKREPTKGWITKARLAFAQKRRVYLSGR